MQEVKLGTRMGSKGRIPPHLWRPLIGSGVVHPDPFAPGIRPPHGAFPPFDMLPPPEVMEQKLAAQHMEMQKLANENQRLADTQGTLRQELAAAQHELQMLHSHMGAVKSEREQQMRGLMAKIAKMEAELQASEPFKMELQQARADAQSLLAARQELVSKVQQLTRDLQRAHSDMQPFPALMSELESLRQEYQHCRGTYDYEKKLYNDHLESLQVMEKNYITMAREVEKLQAELTNTANNERRTDGPYGGATGYKENDATEHYSVGQNAYEDGYGVPQGRGPLPGGGSGGGPSAAAGGGTPTHVGAQSGSAPARPGYDTPSGPGYDVQRGPGGPSYGVQRGPGGLVYDAQRGPGGAGYDSLAGHGYDSVGGPGHDTQRGHGYDAQRGSSYNARRGPGYDGQRGPVYDAHGGLNFDTSKGTGYDASSRGAIGPQGQLPPANNAPYGSATPPTHAGSGYEASRGGNPARR